MKNLLTLLCLIPAFWAINDAQACVDPDSVVIIIVKYDTLATVPCPTANQVELRFSNLRLMSESPNKICACGLSSFSDIFTELEYIAFVDSGTNVPYTNFNAFTEMGSANNAWQSASPFTGDWTGLVSHVINAGLSASDPVELVVRLSAPPNTVITFDSLCSNTTLAKKINDSFLGTDEWDGPNATLKNGHQDIRSLSSFGPDVSSISYTEVNKAYFIQLDNDILSLLIDGVNGQVLREPEWKIFPNPASDQFHIEFDLLKAESARITILDLLGKNVVEIPDQKQIPSGNSQIQIKLPIGLAPGTYLVKVEINNQSQVSRLAIR